MPIPLFKRMNLQIQAWEQRGDPRAFFLKCYVLMSQNMIDAIIQNRFLDAFWVEMLLRRFADYYFDALYLYELQHEKTPVVWWEVHDTTRQGQLHVMQNLLLGINAHINYDLALTLHDVLHGEWMVLSLEQKQERFEDHCCVNKIIAETIDLVQDSIIEPADPRLKIVDVLMGRADEWLLSRLISGWRKDVWQYAEAMLAAKTPEEYEIIRVQLENHTRHRTRQILNLPI